jgi:hypothetical protein
MLFALTVVAVVGVTAMPSSGGLPLFPENHYLVYTVADPLTFSVNLQFRDQWGGWEGSQNLILEKFANPLWEKNGEIVLYDDLVHHTWWRLQPIPNPVRQVKVEHQFGLHDIVTAEAIFLLNPADKDDRIPPPEDWPRRANHYLCYQIIEGEVLNISLDMIDQWGPHQNVALDPYCFCNPVEKTTLDDGVVYPIVDGTMHLTCYRLELVPSGVSFVYDDQFLRNGNNAREECLICLPSLKHETVGTQDTNWGRIKALFGNE